MTYSTVIVNLFVALLSLAVIQVIRDIDDDEDDPIPLAHDPYQ